MPSIGNEFVVNIKDSSVLNVIAVSELFFMRYGKDSIPAIAAFYHFSSQSHFTTVFKQYMGCTPQQYRKL